jgi:hypothetical protein
MLALVMIAGLMALSLSEAQDKKRTGRVIGEVKGQKNTKDDKNTFIEVLAPGEEKAREYHVMWDPKIKGPIPSILAAVRAAKVGDRVELEWIDTNHGPAIEKFQVLKKKD